jgi:hypothetical protein
MYMAKPIRPAPVVVTKFHDGAPVAVETVQPLPDYKKRMMGLPTAKKDAWEPDEIRLDIKIVGTHKNGMAGTLGYAYAGNVDEKVAKFKQDLGPDYEVTTEKLPPIPLTTEEQAAKDLREQRMSSVQRTSRGTSNASGRKMTDQDAREVKFGRLANAKTSAAAAELGLTYGQVYSARNGFTFTHVTEK